MLEQPALADDERFESKSERVENVDALRQAIEGILAQISSEETIERLDEAKIANARMRNVQGFLDHPNSKPGTGGGRWDPRLALCVPSFHR